MNATADAPGADDDASGVAVSMELARVLATHRAALDDHLRRGGRRGAGPLRVDVHGQRSTRPPASTCEGMFTNDIVGSSRGDDGTRDRHQRAALRPGPAAQRGRHHRTRCGSRSAARTTRPPATWPGSSPRWPGRTTTGMDIRVIYRLDRYLRGGDHTGFLAAGLPGRRGSPNRRRTSPTSTRTCGSRTASSIGDLPEFCDFDYIAGVARVNGASLWSLAQAPGMPPRRRRSTLRSSPTTPCSAGRRGDQHRRPGRVRGRLAADHQPVLDPRHRGRQRGRDHHRPLEGQRGLRCPVGQHRRLPEPRGLPVPPLNPAHPGHPGPVPGPCTAVYPGHPGPVAGRGGPPELGHSGPGNHVWVD